MSSLHGVAVNTGSGTAIATSDGDVPQDGWLGDVSSLHGVAVSGRSSAAEVVAAAGAAPTANVTSAAAAAVFRAVRDMRITPVTRRPGGAPRACPTGVRGRNYGALNISATTADTESVPRRGAVRGRHRRVVGGAYAGLTVADAASAADPSPARLSELRETLGDDASDAADDELRGYWRFVLGRLVLGALHRDGWAIEAAPGDPLLCRRGDEAIEPYRELHEATEDAGGRAAWRERCAQVGIAGLPLAAGAPATRRLQSVAPPGRASAA